ncbi:MAG: hypothetical protein AAFN12_00850 [Cyanobacteria bacterium J06560_2]
MQHSLVPNDVGLPTGRIGFGVARTNNSAFLFASPGDAIVRPGSLSPASLLAIRLGQSYRLFIRSAMAMPTVGDRLRRTASSHVSKPN